MKRVLLITYYWPPSGGSGVQRWLKTVRYLRDFGWEPVVYTVENGEYPVIDESLQDEIPEGIEVLRKKIWEPYSIYKQFIGQKKDQRVVSGFLSEEKRPGLTSRLSMWIRGNLFIPDARKFWISPSVRYLKKYLKDHPVDLIVSTGPPHSMHMIGLDVHQHTQIPWVADFRDPWTDIDFYKELMLSKWADRKHHQMEKKVVTTATRVVVVGRVWQKAFEELANRQIDLITNGYDEADMPEQTPAPDTEFSLVHIGMLGASRNHEILWQALSELSAENPDFKQALHIRLIGKIDVSVYAFLEKYNLTSKAELIEYMPHVEAIEAQRKARVLLLLINNTHSAKGIITGKIFEYLASRRPIIIIGPEDGDAAAIINRSKAGVVCGFENKDKLKSHLLESFIQYQQGHHYVNSADVAMYSRKALTGDFASIFDEITP